MEINTYKLNWISNHWVVFFICFCAVCPLWGQADKKKDLTPADYGLWHSLRNINLSDDGNWASFHLSYDAADTLMLQNTADLTKIYIPNARKEIFLQEGRHFVYLESDGLTKLDLYNNKSTYFPQVVDYKISNNHKYWALKKRNPNAEGHVGQTLEVDEIEGMSTITIDNVVEYEFNTSGDVLAFVQKKASCYLLGVVILGKSSLQCVQLNRSENPITKLVWGADRNLAFLEALGVEDHTVHWIMDVVHQQQVQSSSSLDKAIMGKDFRILNTVSTTLHFSNDGKKLFFHFQHKDERALSKNEDTLVQVWNTADKLTYPNRISYAEYYDNPRMLAVWNQSTNTLKSIGTKESPNAIWGTNDKYIYTYGQFDDRVLSNDDKIESPIYVYDTNTAIPNFVMNREYQMPIQISPTGRYLSYFKSQDWWLFDALTKKHLNLTKDLNVIFVNEEYDWSGKIPPYGNPGWTKDEKEILFYDKYDIYKISTDGSKYRKLTNGRKENKIYRIAPDENGNQLPGSFDLKAGTLLKIRDGRDHSTGYAILSENNSLITIIENEGYLSNLKVDDKVETMIYTEENYDRPPALKKYSLVTKKISELHQSNPQHFDFKWSKSELVKYRLEDGTELKGALFYPSDFNDSINYPMIVNIYQKLSSTVNRYQNPTLLTGFDLNISNFTTNGYFVFCPDIVYKINEPGPSALRCVTTGVEAVLKKRGIDRKRVGLFGHSFGGYETSYIISQTDLFAAAVSGAGIQDLVSFYFSMAWLWQVPQSFRFLNHIMRFEKNYFEIPQMYENNSPIHFAKKIHTPLLTITGDKDTNVNWEQSVEMYNALRILEKEHIMLIYPGEGHDFFERSVQIDYNNKLNDWFGYYLKNEHKSKWMLKK